MFVELLLSGLIIASSLAQTSISRYPPYQPVPNFDASEYEGVWYEIVRIPNFHEAEQKCSILDYSLNSNGSFRIDHIFTDINTETVHSFVSLAIPEQGSSARFNFRFRSTEEDKNSILTILSTDYQNYAVQALIERREDSSYWQYAWILSRTPTLSPVHYRHTMNVLRANGIPARAASQVVDQNCNRS